MALREGDQTWSGFRCAQCGGPPEDQRIRKLMGCDAPASKGKVHEIRTRRGVLITDRCPRRQLRVVSPYFKAWKWWEKGQLDMVFPKGAPARIADGIEFISATIAAIQEEKWPTSNST